MLRKIKELIIPSEEVRTFWRLESHISKHKKETKNSIYWLLDNSSFLKEVKIYLQSEDIHSSISCYNQALISTLEKELLKKDYIKKDRRRRDIVSEVSTYGRLMIRNKEMGYIKKIRSWLFCLSSEEEKENKLNYKIIRDIITDKNSSETIVSELFVGIYKKDNKSDFIKKLSRHPNLSEGLVSWISPSVGQILTKLKHKKKSWEY